MYQLLIFAFQTVLALTTGEKKELCKTADRLDDAPEINMSDPYYYKRLREVPINTYCNISASENKCYGFVNAS
ncbi:unnamed protein product, partial [Cylicocyclus nassatus]